MIHCFDRSALEQILQAPGNKIEPPPYQADREPKKKGIKIPVNLYCLDEVKIINQIAGLYSAKGDDKKAVDILDQLIKYIQTHFQNILQSAGHLPLVAHNYALVLYKCKRYSDAIQIAELGKQSCVKFGHYQFLPGIMHVMAICYHYLEDDEKSKDLFRQSFYLYKAVDDQRGAARVQEDASAYHLHTNN